MSEREDGGAVGPRQRAHAQHDHGPFGALDVARELVAARSDLRERVRPVAEAADGESELGVRPDGREREAAGAPALAQARGDEGRFAARVRADEKAEVRSLRPGDGRVEQISCARRGGQRRAVLAAVDMRRAERFREVAQRAHRLGVAKVAGDGAEARPAPGAHPFGDGGEGFVPARRFQPPVAVAEPRPVETPAAQAVAGVAGLVGDPFLVHRLVQPRQDAHDLSGARIDADGAAHGVERIDGFGRRQLP